LARCPCLALLPAQWHSLLKSLALHRENDRDKNIVALASGIESM
jgi:hypothetical protein